MCSRATCAALKAKAAKMVDAATMEKLEAGFNDLDTATSNSLVKKYLTKELFDLLKNRKSTFGSSLLECVQSGFENLDANIGVYAADPESYSLFAELFEPIIEDYHGGFKATDVQPAKYWGDVDAFGNLDPTEEIVFSTRVRLIRNLDGYGFNPILNERQYKEIEEKIVLELRNFEGELKGTYYPISSLEETMKQQLVDDHVLYKEFEKNMLSAKAYNFWPSGRGIYFNDIKSFVVWINEEDHLRLISMQKGGDLKMVCKRLIGAVNEIEKKVPFCRHERFGYLTFSPANIGTTLRASVLIRLPKLTADKEAFEAVINKYNLQVRGTNGENSEVIDGVQDISNRRRIGITEFEAVKEMYDGVTELIRLEKEYD